MGLLSKLGQETYLSDLSGTVSQVTIAGQVDGVSAAEAQPYFYVGVGGDSDGVSAAEALPWFYVGVGGQADGQSDVSGETEPATKLGGQVDGQSETSADLTVESRRVNWEFVSNGWGGENVVDYVLGASWRLGFGEPFNRISDVAQLSLSLRNTDRRFSPEYSQSPYYPYFTFGKIVAVHSIYNGVKRVMFRGWITNIQPAGNQYGQRSATIDVSGFMERAQHAEAFVPLQREVTADQVIEQIITSSVIQPPKAFATWELGVSQLGVDMWLEGETSEWLNLETGVSTFNVIGDRWRDGVSVYGSLRDTAGREGGRLFVDRDGVITFWNRNHLLLDTVADAVFDNTMAAMDYRYGDLFVNDVTVTARPRTLSASPEVLGTLEKAVKIPAGETKSLSIRYGDPDSGIRVAGEDAITPVGGTDYTANDAEDGSGVDYTGSVTATISEESAARSTVAYENSAGVDVWLQAGAQIRGTAIKDYGAIDVRRQDTFSINKYGPRRYTYQYELDDVAEAENMADFLMLERQGPRGRAPSLTLAARNPAVTAQALTRTIGDRIRVVEEQTDIDANYFIIAEMHEVSHGGDYRVGWTLEPAAVYQYWQLGDADYGELGETTNLA